MIVIVENYYEYFYSEHFSYIYEQMNKWVFKKLEPYIDYNNLVKILFKTYNFQK